jgi:hypothetical protein
MPAVLSATALATAEVTARVKCPPSSRLLRATFVIALLAKVGAMHFGIFPNLMHVIAKSLASLGLAQFPYNVRYIRR